MCLAWRSCRENDGTCAGGAFGGDDSGNNQGIGRVGLLKHEMTLGECCELVKEKFHLPDVKVFGDIERKVTRAAISPGSGKSMIDTALQTGAEVLVTGDIGHHEGIDAVARGLDIIDAGHYGLEHIFIEDMAMFLESHLSCVKIEKQRLYSRFRQYSCKKGVAHG